MAFFESDTQLKTGELHELDRVFLNVHQFVKVKFELLSRHVQEEKNPLPGASIGYHFLIKKKDMAMITCFKYQIKNEDYHDVFEEAFMKRPGLVEKTVGFDLPKNVRNYPTNFMFIRGDHKKKENQSYRTIGGFIFQIEYLRPGDDRQIFSKKLRKDLEKNSLKLIKSTIK